MSGAFHYGKLENFTCSLQSARDKNVHNYFLKKLPPQNTNTLGIFQNVLLFWHVITSYLSFFFMLFKSQSGKVNWNKTYEKRARQAKPVTWNEHYECHLHTVCTEHSYTVHNIGYVIYKHIKWNTTNHGFFIRFPLFIVQPTAKSSGMTFVTLLWYLCKWYRC